MSFFWSFPDQKVLTSCLKKFLDKNELDAVEAFLIEQGPEKVKGVGVENLPDYVQNLKVMGELLEEKGRQEQVWQDLEHVFQKLSEKIYSEEIQELMKKKENYETLKLGMDAYVSYLVGLYERVFQKK
ncbi:MAG: hypothetical protein HYS08_03700 [Chlamydiae bacterium]|nr:hypothetical protein [Chlamydiota bacterium]MBI3266900.1 hypothetical protein [Chlamydiota bacterium]